MSMSNIAHLHELGSCLCQPMHGDFPPKMIRSSRRKENSILLTSLLIWNLGLKGYQFHIKDRWVCEMDLSLV